MTMWAMTRRTLRGMLLGAVIGCLLVTIFATGTLLDSGIIWPVAVIQALVFGGLLYGAAPGAFVGALGALWVMGRRARAQAAGALPITEADRALPPARLPLPGKVREALETPDSGPGSAGYEFAELLPYRSPEPVLVSSSATPVPYARPVPLAPLRSAPVRVAQPVVSMQDPERLNRVLEDLDGLPGLESVAERVRGLARRLSMDEARREQGLKTAEVGLHCIFIGPAGTGKTTVARSWGKVLAAVGLLPTGHVVEVDRSDLVGQTVGSTGPQTLAKIAEAEGGVLFIDEAYSLTPEGPGGQDFGSEAVAALLRAMEDRRGRFAVIVAGYPAEMEQFLRSNSGLALALLAHGELPRVRQPGAAGRGAGHGRAGGLPLGPGRRGDAAAGADPASLRAPRRVEPQCAVGAGAAGRGRRRSGAPPRRKPPAPCRGR